MRNLLMLLSAFLAASLFLVAAGCDSSEPVPDDAVLVNRSNSLIGFSVVDKSFHFTQPEPVEFDTGNPSEDAFIRSLAAGNIIKIGICSKKIHSMIRKLFSGRLSL